MTEKISEESEMVEVGKEEKDEVSDAMFKDGI